MSFFSDSRQNVGTSAAVRIVQCTGQVPSRSVSNGEKQNGRVEGKHYKLLKQTQALAITTTIFLSSVAE